MITLSKNDGITNNDFSNNMNSILLTDESFKHEEIITRKSKIGSDKSNFSLNSLNNKMPVLFQRDKCVNSKFTALPFNKNPDSNVPIKMIDIIKKVPNSPKYIVAPDGYIANSKVRQIYPKYFKTEIKKKSQTNVYNEEDNKLIEDILERHLNITKINEATRRKHARATKANQKKHYDDFDNEIKAVQNEVFDHFDFELEKVTSEHSLEEDSKQQKFNLKKHKKHTAHMISTLKAARHKQKTKRVSTGNLVGSNIDENVQISIKSIKISEHETDLLDKIEANIEQFDKEGIVLNQKVQERIMKDRSHRMPDPELKKWLKEFEGIYGSKKAMYKKICKALHKDEVAIENLDSHFGSRTKRLEFLNTITDPQHLFDYFLFYYDDNKNDLITDLNELLLGNNEVLIKQLIKFCGEPYYLNEYLKEFVEARNCAFTLLSDKFKNGKDCNISIEQCIRYQPTEWVLLNIFMSSHSDAELFFHSITHCNIKNMLSIMKDIEKISEINKKIMKKYLTEDAASKLVNIMDEKKEKIDEFKLKLKEEKFEKEITIILPPLPVHDENAWKIFMSQYFSKMLSTILPKSKTDQIGFNMEQNKTILNLMDDMNFIHNELLNLLKQYLNNDVQSAQKLLEGIISEDDLAIKALIEILGENEAIKIIKTLKLRQAKLMEKMLEMRGDPAEIKQAKGMLKSMMNFMPGSLNKHLNKWILPDEDKFKNVIKDINSPAEFELTETTTQTDSDGTNVKEFTTSKYVESDKIIQKLTIDEKTSISVKDYNTTMDAESPYLNEENKDFISYMKEYKMNLTDGLDDIFLDSTISDYSSAQITLPLIPDTTVIETLMDRKSKDESLDSKDETIKKTTIIDTLEEKSSVKTLEKQMKEQTKAYKRLIEKQYCFNICHIPWYSNPPASKYEDLANNIVDLVIKSDDTDKTAEMTKTLMEIIRKEDLEPSSVDKIITKLANNALNLIGDSHEDIKDMVQHIRMAPLKKLGQLTKQSEIEIPGFEKAVMMSYNKQIRIEHLIHVLEDLKRSEFETVKKIYLNKKQEATLFVPEVRAQIDTVEEFGYDKLIPFEILTPIPDTIVRNKKEELKRRKVESRKAHNDDEPFATVTVPYRSEFWEEKSVLTGLPLPKYPLEIREKSSVKDNDDTFIDAPKSFEQEEFPSYIADIDMMMELMNPVSSAHDTQTIEETISVDVLHEMEPPIIMRPVDQINYQDEIQEAAGNLYLPDESISKSHLPPISYKVEKATLVIPKPTKRVRYPTNPYNDFHLMYGANSYFLPFINPVVAEKSKSGEDLMPSYDDVTFSENKQSSIIFNDVSKMVTKFGISSHKSTPFFNKARLMPRPSGVPLKDWVKIGVPGMASNMTVSKSHRKHKPRVGKLRTSDAKPPVAQAPYKNFGQFGLSPTNVEKRSNMVDLITKANAATLSENVKLRVLSKISQKSRKSSSSSNSKT